MAFCVKCGIKLPMDCSFCPACGTDLRQWKQRNDQTPAQNTANPIGVEAQPVEEVQIPVQQEQPVEEVQIPVQQEQPAEETQSPVQQEQPPVRQWESLQQIQAEKETHYEQQWQPVQPVKEAETTQVPGKALCIVGRILGILGFVTGLIFMLLSLLLMALLTTGEITMTDAGIDTEVLLQLLMSGVEVLALSVVGLILSNKAQAKGNPATGKGRTFSLLGVVFTAIFMVNAILCLVICAFSQGGLYL